MRGEPRSPPVPHSTEVPPPSGRSDMRHHQVLASASRVTILDLFRWGFPRQGRS